MGRVRPEEAAAVGAELLDRDHRRHRAHGDRLRLDLARPSIGFAWTAPSNVIGTPVATSEHRDDERERHEHEDEAPHHVQVEVAQMRVAAQAAKIAPASPPGRTAGVTNWSQTIPPSWLKYDRCCSPE